MNKYASNKYSNQIQINSEKINRNQPLNYKFNYTNPESKCEYKDNNFTFRSSSKYNDR